MRIRLTLFLAVAVCAAALIAGGAAAVQSPTLQGPDGNTQSIAVNYKPTKLSKTAPEPITLEVKTATLTTNPSANNGAPIPAVQAIVDFAKGTQIFSKGYPTCDA